MERQRGVAVGALFVPLILISLTLVGHRSEPTYQWFLERFVSRLGGTPFYLTVLISAGFFAYAVLRRVPMALDALMAAMVAIAFVSPGTLDLTELVPPRMLPILVVAVSQTAIGLWRRSIGRSVVGSSLLVAVAMIAVRGTSAQSHPGPLAFHLTLIAALAVGAFFNDRIGQVLRTLGASMAVLGSLLVLTGRIEPPAWHRVMGDRSLSARGLLDHRRLWLAARAPNLAGIGGAHCVFLSGERWLAGLLFATSVRRRHRLYRDRHAALRPGGSDQHVEGRAVVWENHAPQT